MLKFNFSKPRLPASACLSAALSLALLLPITSLRAQSTCSNPGGDTSVSVSPLTAHIGDNVCVLNVQFRVLSDECNVTNLVSYLSFPNSNTVKILDSTIAASGPLLAAQGQGASAGFSPNPTFNNHADYRVSGVNFCYTINASDLGNSLVFTLAPNKVCSASAGPNEVVFLASQLAIADTASGPQKLQKCDPITVQIVHPGVKVTKECAYPNGQTCFRAGQPIAVRGTVQNTGDVALVIQSLVDDKAGNIMGLLSSTTLAPFGQPGDTATYTASYNADCTGASSNGNGVNEHDTVTVIAADTINNPNGTNPNSRVTNSASADCRCINPCLTVTKTCVSGTVCNDITFTGTINNCGNVALANLAVADKLSAGTGTLVIRTNSASGAIVTLPITLAPGATLFASGTISGLPGSYTDTLTATGTVACLGNASFGNSDTKTCTIEGCQPGIQVVKLVACAPIAPGTCDALPANAYSKLAKGMKGADDSTCPTDNGCPAFCYKITVTNTGLVSLVNVTLVDDNGTPGNTSDDTSFNIGNLAVGASATRFIAATHCTDAHNTVRADGQSSLDSTPSGHVSATDTADVQVVPISVSCTITVDAGALDSDGKTIDTGCGSPGLGGVSGDGPEDNHAKLSSVGRLIMNLCITGDANADLNVGITVDAGLQSVFSCLPGTVLVQKGQTVTLRCTNNLTACNPASGNVHVKGTPIASTNFPCIYNICGHAVTTPESTCSASIECTPAIKVEKLVTCFDATVPCDQLNTYSKLAAGMKGADDSTCPTDNGCPGFCYKITVTNTGSVDLVSVTLRDDNGTPGNTNDDTFINIGNLAVGASATRFFSATHCTDAHNTVRADGQSSVDTTPNGHVSATDTADVRVVPISVSCTITVDAGSLDTDGKTIDTGCGAPGLGGVTGNGPEDNHASLSSPGPVIMNLCIKGDANADLNVSITVDAGLQGLFSCLPSTVIVSKGQTVTLRCTNNLTACIAASGSVHVKGTPIASTNFPCIYNVCGHAVTTPESTCTAQVECRPAIRVEKLVACVDPNTACDQLSTYSKLASGVRGADDPNCPGDNNGCPGFCYKITVTNTGGVDLVNVTLRDDNGTPSNTSDDILIAVGNLAVGASSTHFFSATHCTDAHNTVRADGQSAVDSTPSGHVSATDTADVHVAPINVSCKITVDAGTFDTDGTTIDDSCSSPGLSGVIGDKPEDNHATLPQGFVGPVILNLCITGDNDIDLNVSITVDAGLQSLFSCLPSTVLVPKGQTVTLRCTNDLNACTPASGSVHVKGTAVATVPFTCIYNVCGHAVTTAESACPAQIECEAIQNIECRTTGGGDLLPGFSDDYCITATTEIFPFTQGNYTINKITHGGQLGAPFSHRDCGEILSNPCIRGNWSHHRHYLGKGNPRDLFDTDFHSLDPNKSTFDSLLCACLGCCLNGQPHDAFTSPAKKFALCNPGDRVCGPEPRPAPANAIIFSGIGKMTPETDSGSRLKDATWWVFRVYIEDRSEPGNKNARNGADIYCFQAYRTGILVSKKPDYTTIATDIRRAIAADNCEFLSALDDPSKTYQGRHIVPGNLPSPTIGNITFDVRDCGPLATGNHQIHPATGANPNCVDPAPTP